MAVPGPQRGRKTRLDKQREDRTIAVRNVIEPEELRFCQIYLAFGERDASEAYRRAFCRRNSRGHWVEVGRNTDLTRDEINDLEPMDVGLAAKRSSGLLKQRHIQEALAEIKKSPSEHARQTLANQILFGTEREKAKALELVLKEEDKLGLRDAAELWAEVMCEIGAEVIVPLTQLSQRGHCSECGAEQDFNIDISAEIDISEFFPQFEPERSYN